MCSLFECFKNIFIDLKILFSPKIDEFIKERERYATIGDDLDLAFVELIPGVEYAYNDRHPKPPTPIKIKSPTPLKEPTPPGWEKCTFFLCICEYTTLSKFSKFFIWHTMSSCMNKAVFCVFFVLCSIIELENNLK